jgi:hypothetical protein
MASLASINAKEKSQRKATLANVNLRMDKHVIPMFKETNPIQKTDFQIRCEQGVSIEDARKQTHDFIEELWKRKK